MKRIILALAVFCIPLIAAGQNPWDHRNHPNWDRSWNQRPFPPAGACFFTDRNFQGNRFCVNRGDKLSFLPGNFGDNISSIQIFGRSRVVVFNDRDFRGGSDAFGNSIADLRTRPFRDGHTWNNRISSVIVR